MSRSVRAVVLAGGLVLGGAVAAVVVSAGPAAAACFTWAGGASGTWENTANWPGGVLPKATDDVCFSGTTTVTVNNAGDVANSINGANATLSMVSGQLTVTGGASSSVAAITQGGGTLELDGAMTSTGASPSYTMTGGILQGQNGTLTLAHGMSWSSGSIQTLSGVNKSFSVIVNGTGSVDGQGVVTGDEVLVRTISGHTVTGASI